LCLTILINASKQKIPPDKQEGLLFVSFHLSIIQQQAVHHLPGDGAQDDGRQND
jgi:hypothetical protein